MNFKQFVNKHGIRIESEYTDSNPNMPDSREMDHWKVILRMGKKQSTSYFSKGYGHHGAEPTADEVLECTQMDISGIVNGESFEDFCHEFGYDEDSRKAEKIYKACIKEEQKTRKFLGEHFDEFMELQED